MIVRGGDSFIRRACH